MAHTKHIEDDTRVRLRKIYSISAVFISLFILLAIKLFYLQVINAERNIKLSKENQMTLKTLHAPRGLIYDRNGKILARNRPSYSISILPYRMKDREQLVKNLLKIKDDSGAFVFDSLRLEKKINKAQYRRFDETRLKEDVPISVVSIIEEHLVELPGIIINTESRREYPMLDQTFHVLGYTGEIPSEIFDSLRQKGYRYGDKMGRYGIEKEYEKKLRGENGHEYVETNAYGRELGVLENMPRKEFVPGDNLSLTIDSRLQRIAADSFPDTLKGSVVALNPRNGDVLVLCSFPSIDPNIFSLSSILRSKSWERLSKDKSLPLNNRAIAGTYPPGSTFKPVSGFAGVATGKIGPKEHMPAPCTGAYRIGTRVAHCWYRKGHGYLDMAQAVKHSCNVYFYQVGLKIGYQDINKYAEQLGLGIKTGIDLPGEKKGWLSGKEAYNERFKDRGYKWTKGLVLDLAIGQQQIVTPLQLAVMTGALGNGRFSYKPRLLKEVINHEDDTLKQMDSEILDSISVKDTAAVTAIRHAMREVVLPGGTGWRAGVKGVPVGGKTGSAENPHGEDTHALFIACAPVDDPVISIAVVVENAGHGGSVAAPIAGDVLRYFFNETETGKAISEEYSGREDWE